MKKISSIKQTILLICDILSNEYECFVHALYIRVNVTCYADIAYIADKYNLIYCKSKLYRDGSTLASFKIKQN